LPKRLSPRDSYPEQKSDGSNESYTIKGDHERRITEEGYITRITLKKDNDIETKSR
jgi:hypothetical protein